MSLGAPVHALNMQTNVNANRYFFATQEAGEQELFLSTISGGGPAGNISSLAVGISGPAGNAVIVSEAPTFIASEFIEADKGLAGGGSGYWTLSSISTNLTGISMSTDRIPGSGNICIEAYSGNGPFYGFEFMTRGLDSQLISTTSAGINTYMSSIGRPGATAVLSGSGTFVTGAATAGLINSTEVPTGGGGRIAFAINDLSGGDPLSRWGIGTTTIPSGGNTGSDYALYNYADNGAFLGVPMAVRRSDGAMTIANLSSVNGSPYPQTLFSTPVTGLQGAVLPSTVPTVLYTINNAVTSNMVAGKEYLVDFPIQFNCAAPGGSGAFLDWGVRCGGNGDFNYSQNYFIPPGGTQNFYISQSVVQHCDMGSANKNIDIIGYLQGATNLSISTGTSLGSNTLYIKNVT